MHALLRSQLSTRLLSIPALRGASVVWQPVQTNLPVPALILRLVDDTRGASHAGSDGLGQSRVQLDAYAADAASAGVIRDAVLDNLHGFSGPVIPGGEVVASCLHGGSLEDWDESSGLFRASCDLVFQYYLPVNP